jgi:hypothetical protein
MMLRVCNCAFRVEIFKMATVAMVTMKVFKMWSDCDETSLTLGCAHKRKVFNELWISKHWISSRQLAIGSH